MVALLVLSLLLREMILLPQQTSHMSSKSHIVLLKEINEKISYFLLLFFQYIMLLRELEEKFKSGILEKMKKKGIATDNMTIADIDMDADYSSDMESRYEL